MFHCDDRPYFTKNLGFFVKKRISNVIASTGAGTTVLQGWGDLGMGGTSAVLTLDEKGGRLGWNASLLSRSAPCQNNMEIYICFGPTIYLCVIS